MGGIAPVNKVSNIGGRIVFTVGMVDGSNAPVIDSACAARDNVVARLQTFSLDFKVAGLLNMAGVQFNEASTLISNVMKMNICVDICK